MPILPVDARCAVAQADLDGYIAARRAEVGRRLGAALENFAVARDWLERLSEEELYETKEGERKFIGDPASEGLVKEAVARAKATSNPVDIVAAVEDLILFFCGFNNMKPHPAKCIVNAVHFQFVVDVDRLLAQDLSLPSAAEAPTAAEKDIFDAANVGLAELLLRVVVDCGDGGNVANPFSPGMPMGKLLKLPIFAQFVMVLTNATEAMWYQEAISVCPMAINLYASLLVEDSPVELMTEGVSVVEVMEMTKGARRGPAVVEWVGKMRAAGRTVMLDDFDAKHPGIDSQPDGIKVSVFANAFHSLQAFKNEDGLLPIADMSHVANENPNGMNFLHYYRSLVPQHQGKARILIMEGSENCLKSEVNPGPPLNFGEASATTATAHVYKAAALAMRGLCDREGSKFEMFHQGGRALYADEDFDEDACAVIAACGKAMPAARTGDAGTIAWMGEEARRRAEMRERPRVCGVVKKSA